MTLCWRFARPVLTAGSLVGCGRVLTWSSAAPLLAARAGTATLADLVTLAAAAVAGLLLSWIGLVLGLTVLAGAPGKVGRLATKVSRVTTTAQTQRLARLALGLSVAVGPIALVPVAMAPLAAAAPRTPTSASVDRLPEIGRPELTPSLDTHGDLVARALALPPIGRPAVGRPLIRNALGPSPVGLSPPTRQVVTVATGDTLWSIAARALGPDASNLQIAREWPRWYAINRAVIGADPDSIHPGMLLRPPPAGRADP